MEWWLSLIIILGALLALMAFGIPTAFCFFIGRLLSIVGENPMRQLGFTPYAEGKGKAKK